MDITNILDALVKLLIAVAIGVIIPAIRKLLNEKTLREIEYWVNVAVNAVEQENKNKTGMGAQKKADVLKFIESKGLKVDPEALDRMIESAVYELKKQQQLEKNVAELL